MSLPNRNFIYFIYFAFILIIFAGFRPIGFDFDSQSYSELIYYESLMVEPTFLLITYFAELFTNDKEFVVRIVFLSYAFLNILILSIAINKFIKFNIISLLFYVFIAYAMLTITQIRFGVAVAFFLWALYDLSNSDRKNFIIKVFIAISFHYSVILALPFVFLSSSNFNKKMYFFLPLVSLIGILFQDYLLNLLINNLNIFSEYLSAKLSIYSKRQHEVAMPIINVLSILIIFIYYTSLVIIDRINNKNILILIKVLGWGISFYFIFSFIEVFSKRIMFALGTIIVILIPIILANFKQRRILLFALIMYVFLYFINSTVNNGLLNYELYFSLLNT